ncbi:MAG: hypothetical protein ACQETO_03510 [Pseudomonadota bacterium]
MNRLPLILLTAVAVLLTATPAHAYLDPGTGSAIIQGLLAAGAALVVTLKLYWHRLLRLLGIGGKRDGQRSEPARKSSAESDADEPTTSRSGQR